MNIQPLASMAERPASQNRKGGPGPRADLPQRLAGATLVIAFAVLYLLTLDNGLRPDELVGGDLITHQYAQVQGRPGNAPGYPLYTMGGWLWFRLGRLVLGPRANPIPILSSYSTLWALVALWLLYRLSLEVTGQGRGNWPVACLVTTFYGVTYFFWYYAVTTEQYTSAVAWTLALFLCAWRWQRTRRESYLLVMALLVGIGLAHQVTILVAVPPVLWFIWANASRQQKGLALFQQPRYRVAALALALLPLLSYAYVYVRGAQHPEWRGAGQWASSWQWFWDFLSTAQGRAELTWSWHPLFTSEFPSLIWGEMTWPGLVAGLLGWAMLERRQALTLYLTLLLYLLFCWIDRLGNWYQVIMPVYALLTLGIARLADQAWHIGERLRPGKGAAPQPAESCAPGHGLPGAWPRVLVLLGLVALLAFRGAISYPRADCSNRPEDTALEPGWAILADDPLPGTAIFGTLPETLALSYLTQIWGLRADLRPVTSLQAREILADGGLLAVTRDALPLVPAEISPDAHYTALGQTLVALNAAAQHTLPNWGQATLPWKHDFSTELRLIAGRVERRGAGPAGQKLSGEEEAQLLVMLAWQAPRRPSQDWSVSVRLRRANQEIAQRDLAHPVHGAYPTTRWSPGEVVADAYAFTLPAGVWPDGVTVIVYRRTSDGEFVNLDTATFALP